MGFGAEVHYPCVYGAFASHGVPSQRGGRRIALALSHLKNKAEDSFRFDGRGRDVVCLFLFPWLRLATQGPAPRGHRSSEETECQTLRTVIKKIVDP